MNPPFIINQPTIGIPEAVAPQIWTTLVEADHEFLPPLSQRGSGTQTTFSPVQATQSTGPVAYFDSIRHQDLLTACLGSAPDTVAGFMSYRPESHLPDTANQQTYHYVTTVVVHPAFRGHRLTQQLYEKLLATAYPLHQGVATRTWSTNTAHMRLLHRLGFTPVHRIPDDRGPGIDTVYFAKDI